MKKILLLFLVSCTTAFSQIGIKPVLVRPTGDLGMIMKPTVSAELFYKSFPDDDDNRLVPRFGISYFHFKPRLDTFPVAGLIVSQTTTVSPGTMSYQKYDMLNLYGGVDYYLKISDSFYLYPGIDVTFGGTSVQYQANYPLISSEGYSGGSVYVGFGFRAGAEYFVKEKIGIFIEAKRSMNLIPHESFMNYNDYGIGVRYNFMNR